MKGTLRFIPALAVMLAAVLSLGVCASADALPRETVGFDYSRQEARGRLIAKSKPNRRKTPARGLPGGCCFSHAVYARLSSRAVLHMT